MSGSDRRLPPPVIDVEGEERLMREAGWPVPGDDAPAPVPPPVAAGPPPVADRFTSPVVDPSELTQVRGEEPRGPRAEVTGGGILDEEVVARLAAAVSREVAALLPPPGASSSADLDRLVREVASSLAWLRAGQHGSGGPVPAWLLQAAGDPSSYDGPDPRREFVGWNVLPSTRGLLKQTQTRLGLRTLTGTLDYLVRLGVAASSGVSARR